nr:ABC transporter permease [uncultured Schaedlerella sp.]
MNGKGVLAVFREEYTLQLGSSILVSAGGKERELPVVGVLGDVPFSYGKSGDTEVSAGMVICSEEFFQKLTGESGYAVIDIQLEQNADDAQVQEIRRACEQACGGGFVYSDKRIGNQEVKGASSSMAVFLYGFLGVIALISFFNIINCISMGVSARLREYGAMRAIGMSVRQVIRMVAGEALTYTAFGVLLGCAAGLPLNRKLFMALVTSRWGEAWSLPVWEMLVIVLIMIGSVCAAVAGPAGQIRKMTVVDTIGG